jgi:hypothetical protein
MVDTEEKFKEMYLTCVLVYYCKDQEQKYYSNPALELLGLTEDQLLGKTSFDPEWKSDS